ncbi:hypothetical protein ACYZUC_13975 [Pseudomonas sp. GT1P32]
MVVNDYAYGLAHRGALESIASKLAPTMDRVNVENELLFKSKKVPKKGSYRHEAPTARRILWRAGWPD